MQSSNGAACSVFPCFLHAKKWFILLLLLTYVWGNELLTLFPYVPRFLFAIFPHHLPFSTSRSFSAASANMDSHCVLRIPSSSSFVVFFCCTQSRYSANSPKKDFFPSLVSANVRKQCMLSHILFGNALRLFVQQIIGKTRIIFPPSSILITDDRGWNESRSQQPTHPHHRNALSIIRGITEEEDEGIDCNHTTLGSEGESLYGHEIAMQTFLKYTWQTQRNTWKNIKIFQYVFHTTKLHCLWLGKHGTSRTIADGYGGGSIVVACDAGEGGMLTLAVLMIQPLPLPPPPLPFPPPPPSICAIRSYYRGLLPPSIP